MSFGVINSKRLKMVKIKYFIISLLAIVVFVAFYLGSNNKVSISTAFIIECVGVFLIYMIEIYLSKE